MTVSELALQIYYDILDFLKEGGYISNINKLLEEESIDDRMTGIDIPSAGLNTIDAINCILDRNRTFALMDEIEKAIMPKEIIVEAGVGTGILAVFAAALGAKVYGVEINKKTFKLARDIFRMFARKGILDEENINLVMADASKWEPPTRIDHIISENIYTGMYYEMQIPIVNHLLEFISPSGRVIPESMESYLILAETERPFEKVHGESFSATKAEGLVNQSRELSNPTLYDKINFKQKNDIYCQVDKKISVKRSGLVNSLLIYSPVTIAKNMVLQREDMIFMGDDIFIVIDPPVRVTEGSNTRLRMAYKRGGKPEDGKYVLEVL